MNRLDLISQRLRELRTGKGWSLRDLSARTGLSIGFIHDIESGRTAPSLRTVEKLAAAFNVPVAFVLGENQAPNQRTSTLPEGSTPQSEKDILEVALAELQRREGLSDEELADFRAYLEMGLKMLRARRKKSGDAAPQQADGTRQPNLDSRKRQ